MKRKTEKDYHKLAESRDFKWVGGVLPKTVKDPTLWECEKGHRWETRYNSIQQGVGCLVCSNRILKTEKDYHELAENRGFKWVGKVLPKSNKNATWWECEKGHRWKARYNNIKCGSSCQVCSNRLPRVEKDYHKLANSRRFKWVGALLPKNTNTSTWWECEKGDRWEAKYQDIKNGSGCPVCNNRVPKTEEDYHILAESCGFKWVGGVLPKYVIDRTWWECGEGHKWEAVYSNIQQGKGCSICSGKVRKTEKDYHELAESRKFKWVGVGLPTVITKTWWECEKGHRWQARYSDIKTGSGCPYCKSIINGHQVSKPQIKLNNLLCGSLNYPEGKYCIDVAITRNSQKIAVEYDCQYWHAGREDHDAKRDGFLISRGWKVLHIKSSHLLPTRKQLTVAIGHLLNTGEKVHNIYLEDWK